MNKPFSIVSTRKKYVGRSKTQTRNLMNQVAKYRFKYKRLLALNKETIQAVIVFKHEIEALEVENIALKARIASNSKRMNSTKKLSKVRDAMLSAVTELVKVVNTTDEVSVTDLMHFVCSPSSEGVICPRNVLAERMRIGATNTLSSIEELDELNGEHLEQHAVKIFRETALTSNLLMREKSNVIHKKSIFTKRKSCEEDILSNIAKKKSIECHDTSINSKKKSIGSHDKSVIAKKKLIDGHDKSINAKKSIEGNDKSINAKKKSIDGHDKSINAKKSIEGNDKSINAKKTSIECHDTSINSKKKSIEFHDTSINSKKKSIGSHDKSVIAKKKLIDGHDKTINAKKSIEGNDKSINTKKKSIDGHDKWINAKKKSAQGQDKSINPKKKSIVGFDKSINAKKKSIEGHDNSINPKKKSIVGFEKSINAKKKSIEGHDNSINAKKKSTEGHNKSINAKKSIEGHDKSIIATKKSIDGHDKSIDGHDKSIIATKKSIDGHDKSIIATKKLIEGHDKSIITTKKLTDASIIAKKSIEGRDKSIQAKKKYIECHDRLSIIPKNKLSEGDMASLISYGRPKDQNDLLDTAYHESTIDPEESVHWNQESTIYPEEVVYGNHESTIDREETVHGYKESTINSCVFQDREYVYQEEANSEDQESIFDQEKTGSDDYESIVDQEETGSEDQESIVDQEETCSEDQESIVDREELNGRRESISKREKLKNGRWESFIDQEDPSDWNQESDINQAQNKMIIDQNKPEANIEVENSINDNSESTIDQEAQESILGQEEAGSEDQQSIIDGEKLRNGRWESISNRDQIKDGRWESFIDQEEPRNWHQESIVDLAHQKMIIDQDNHPESIIPPEKNINDNSESTIHQESNNSRKKPSNGHHESSVDQEKPTYAHRESIIDQGKFIDHSVSIFDQDKSIDDRCESIINQNKSIDDLCESTIDHTDLINESSELNFSGEEWDGDDECESKTENLRMLHSLRESTIEITLAKSNSAHDESRNISLLIPYNQDHEGSRELIEGNNETTCPSFIEDSHPELPELMFTQSKINGSQNSKTTGENSKPKTFFKSLSILNEKVPNSSFENKNNESNKGIKPNSASFNQLKRQSRFPKLLWFPKSPRPDLLKTKIKNDIPITIVKDKSPILPPIDSSRSTNLDVQDMEITETLSINLVTPVAGKHVEVQNDTNRKQGSIGHLASDISELSCENSWYSECPETDWEEIEIIETASKSCKSSRRHLPFKSKLKKNSRFILRFPRKSKYYKAKFNRKLVGRVSNLNRCLPESKMNKASLSDISEEEATLVTSTSMLIVDSIRDDSPEVASESVTDEDEQVSLTESPMLKRKAKSKCIEESMRDDSPEVTTASNTRYIESKLNKVYRSNDSEDESHLLKSKSKSMEDSMMGDKPEVTLKSMLDISMEESPLFKRKAKTKCIEESMRIDSPEVTTESYRHALPEISSKSKNMTSKSRSKKIKTIEGSKSIYDDYPEMMVEPMTAYMEDSISHDSPEVTSEAEEITSKARSKKIKSIKGSKSTLDDYPEMMAKPVTAQMVDFIGHDSPEVTSKSTKITLKSKSKPIKSIVESTADNFPDMTSKSNSNRIGNNTKKYSKLSKTNKVQESTVLNSEKMVSKTSKSRLTSKSPEKAILKFYNSKAKNNTKIGTKNASQTPEENGIVPNSIDAATSGANILNKTVEDDNTCTDHDPPVVLRYGTRSRRGPPVSYKLPPLNQKMRRD